MTYEEKPEQTLREGADHLTNEASTCEPGDAGLTQRRSRRVRKRPATPEQRKLIAIRVRFGADTPKGASCSNLVEQLGHYPKAVGVQRADLAKLIPEQIARLARP
ncbi:hypothetical protein [uncultured Bradyrhizobium sp.]|uniref:hypothetical protein n=1 Tax=uncultured Bradyrhizobium sp. TaxID=199684 RepID=UPI0035CBDAE0